MRRRIQSWLASAHRWLADPPPTRNAEDRATIDAQARMLDAAAARETQQRSDYMERVAELVEATQMAGAGPWRVNPAVIERSNRLVSEAASRYGVSLRETTPPASIGATGDIELMLQNVEWRREINFSWMEFSRWGIQQIILISRLYYIKNTVVRRLVDVCAAYVFARGVELSSPDPDANAVLERLVARNRKVLGQVALTDLERRKDYDGNLFFCLFADKQDTGEVNIRIIESTEIEDIITDPEDSATPWYYHRTWIERTFNTQTGAISNVARHAYYPALGYEPDVRPEVINSNPVMWDSPVYHRKCGTVSGWLFGCPRIYPMLDWAREAKKYLESCASVQHSHASIALTLTTKGGQQALMGAKAQLQTTEGPNNSLWDQNPPAIDGSIFASGTGTKLEAFKTAGAGPDPEKVRQYKLNCAMVAGVPETFLGDVSTGNLATATSLDRPTETVMLEKQEAWSEDLTVIGMFALSVSLRAPNGKLREAIARRRAAGNIKIREASFTRNSMGRRVYETAGPAADAIEVKVVFPAIREGDTPARIGAIVTAMTLNNRGGQVVGIDEKAGVTLLQEELGIPKPAELADEMYPPNGADAYDPDRTEEVLPAPIGKLPIRPGGSPEGGIDPEAIRMQQAEAYRRLSEAARIFATSNGR